MKTEIGVVERLQTLKELHAADGCDELFYTQARTETLQELVQRPDIRWSAMLPNLTVTLGFVFLAFVFAFGLRTLKVHSLPIVITASLAATIVVFLITTWHLRRERIRKATWTRAQRLAELDQLRDQGLVTQEEYGKMHAQLAEFSV